MTTIDQISQDDLLLIRDTSVTLRDKLMQLEREGPLLKLLHREILLINDELAARAAQPASKTQQPEKPIKHDAAETQPSRQTQRTTTVPRTPSSDKSRHNTRSGRDARTGE